MRSRSAADGQEAQFDGGRNQFLRVLPSATRLRLAAHLEPVRLARGEVLARAHEPLPSLYFPSSAVVSLMARAESGQMLEVGIIGCDGVVGVAGCPGVSIIACDAVTQVGGGAYRLNTQVLQRELGTDAALSQRLRHYVDLLFVRCMQICVCNMFHSVEHRCVRWLLTVHDLVGQDAIPLTHELLAAALGVHRPTVTLAIGALQRSGLIDEERGRIVVRDRRGLETASCECYRVLRKEQRRLLGY